MNLEIGTLRAILSRNRLWAEIQPDVRMLPTRDDIGRAVSPEEEEGSAGSRAAEQFAVLAARRDSRAEHVHAVLRDSPAAVAPGGLRCTRHHRGKEQDRFRHGPSDSAEHARRCGSGVLGKQLSGPAADRLCVPLRALRGRWRRFHACAYDTDPTKPIGRWKEAWEAAKNRAKVECRFHDLRHTGCTRMLEAGGLSGPGMLMGWSPATTVRMAKRYGHIGQTR